MKTYNCYIEYEVLFYEDARFFFKGFSIQKHPYQGAVVEVWNNVTIYQNLLSAKVQISFKSNKSI